MVNDRADGGERRRLPGSGAHPDDASRTQPLPPVGDGAGQPGTGQPGTGQPGAGGQHHGGWPRGGDWRAETGWIPGNGWSAQSGWSPGDARERGLRRSRRVSNWTVAALIAGVAAATGYLAHAIPATGSGSGGTVPTGTSGGRQATVAPGSPTAPDAPGPVATSGGSGSTGSGSTGSGSTGGGDN